MTTLGLHSYDYNYRRYDPCGTPRLSRREGSMHRDLETRVATLEKENELLRGEVSDLRRALADCRHQIVMLHELIQHEPVTGFHLISKTNSD